MAEKNSVSKIVNLLLSFSIFFFLVIFIVAAKDSFEYSKFLYIDLPVFMLLLCVISLVLSVIYTKKAYQLFISGYIFLSGVFQFLIINHFLPFTFRQGWPIMGFFASLGLFFVGKVKYKKWKIGYVLPASVIFIFSIIFILFSFRLIKEKFSFVIVNVGPVLLVGLLVWYVIFFILQKHNKNLLLEEDDEEDSFEDDMTYSK